MTRLSRTLLVLAAACAVAVTVAPAHADVDGMPPVIGGGTGANPNPGSGGGTPPGGTSGTPPKAPDGYHWVYDTIPLGHKKWSWSEQRGANLYHIVGACRARDVPGPNGGKQWFATGASIKYLVNDESGDISNYDFTCTWPARPSDVVVTCAKSAVVSISKQRGLIGESLPRAMGSQSKTSAWASDWTDPVKCANSAIEVSMYKPLIELGGYQVDTAATTVACTKRVWHDGAAAMIVACGKEFVRTTATPLGVYCDAATGRVTLDKGSKPWEHDWSWEPCTTASGELSCPTLDNQSPQFDDLPNGVTEVEALDDGVAHNLFYPSLTVKGIVGEPTGVQSELIVSGAPRRPGLSADGDTQPFDTKVRFGWQNGDITVWPTAWYAPGTPGADWIGTKRVRFTAQVKMMVTVIETVDMDGTIKFGTQEKIVTVNTSCKSAPLRIAVHAARNTTN